MTEEQKKNLDKLIDTSGSYIISKRVWGRLRGKLKEKDAEIERLKGLEERAFCAAYLNSERWKTASVVDAIANGDLRKKWDLWQQFKIENNL